jgi:hypothetical protein
VTSQNTRIYVGRLDQDGPAVYAVESVAVERLHPGGDGFRWGAAAGDATLELARVLLTDAGGADPPADACRRFTEQILVRLPDDGFALQRETVSAWLRRYVTV